MADLTFTERRVAPRRGPMRVGMICPYSLNVPGGVQQQVMGLSRELRRMGVEVRVLAPCDGPPPATFVTPLGNSLPTSANGSVAPLAPDLPAQLRTIRVLADEDFDVLHLHEPIAPGPTMTALWLHTAPVIATFHSAGDSLAYRIFTRTVNTLSDRIDVRVAVSKDAAELAGRYLGGEYEILFNGVVLDEYRAAVPVERPGPTIFFCGRHEERKGLEVLLAAMASLPADTTLWVAGTGPDTDRLRSRYASDRRVHWLGRVTDADKLAHLKAADVFCAPSLHGESFGVVLIEAMAAGTAIVASGIDGYRNVATDEVDALLVPPGDVAALAGAISRALGDPALRERLVTAGQARADDFSMHTLAEVYLARYRAILAERNHRRAAGASPGWWQRARMLMPSRDAIASASRPER